MNKPYIAIKISTLSFVMLILAVIQLFSLSLNAFAITPIDVNRPSSLTVHYSEASQNVKIYRVCSVDESGQYSLVSPFNDYPVNVYGYTSLTEWKNLSSTLSSYVVADSISPTYETITNENGDAVFSNIKTGMYLVLGLSFEQEGKTIVYESFITLVPYPSEDGKHEYNVESYPKHETTLPEKEKYKIIKQWKDNGFSEKRPENVYVDIYKNGLFYDTKVLNSENNWSYSWESESSIIWTAVERDVPTEYTVTIVKNGNAIVITNVYEDKETPPGKPGDKGNIYYFIIIALLTGVGLLALSRSRLLKEE